MKETKATDDGPVVLMSIGPGEQELERLQDFLQGLWYWEPQVRTIVLVDDALKSRNLESLIVAPQGFRVHSILHPRQGVGVGVWGGLTEGVLIGMNWIAENLNASMVLKTDTDALVIGPFVDKALNFFASNPEVGMIGLHDTKCSGETKNYAPWDQALPKWTSPIGFHLRTPSLRFKVRQQLVGAAGRIRQAILRARDNGYEWGEHCIGGAYIVRGAAVRALRDNGYFRDSAFWRHTLLSEDVTMGMYTRASGWKLAGYAEPGQIFGVEHKGLPFPPADLQAKDYALIHAIKNDTRFSEAEIREFFRSYRV